MDDKQVQWLDKELAASGSDWKIAFFHHPRILRRHARLGNVLRDQLEPLFVKYGVNAVFTGHEHFYERVQPQKGVAYFIAGSSQSCAQGTSRSLR
jgi:3',5'-cyclic AMP phosphodiesterase CpdA